MTRQIVVSHKIPPIYDKLKERFKVDWDKGLIIAWDGKIHCKEFPQAQKIVHEDVHLNEQEKMGNEAWWDMYFESDSFRLEQEAMAYKAEAAFIRKNIKNREHRFQMIRDIANAMAGSMYGSLVTPAEAMKILK